MNRRDLLLATAWPILMRAIGAPEALATATGDNRRAVLDGFLRQQVERQRVIGITAQVVRRDGEIVYAGAAGQRDPSANEPIRPDMTLFRLASMTKPITAVAVLMLVEAGRITLEDPVSRFLPDFQALQVQTQPGHTVPEVRPPTIRDLLRHTSGLSYRFMNVPGIVEAYEWLGVDDGLAAPDLTLAENLRRLAHAPLQAQPGTRWGYGLSFDVLGAIVERASDQPLDVFVMEQIARPLGLTSLTFHVPRSEAGRMAMPMMVAEGGGLRPIVSEESVPFPVTGGQILFDPERAFSAEAYPSGGGGATSTLVDYVRFARLLLNGGELDSVRLLREETVAAMSQPQTGGLPIDLAGAGYDFGYGVAVLTDPPLAKTRQPRGAYGWSGVYGTGLSVDPASGLAFVVMTQTAVEGMTIADEFVRAFYDHSG
jgi:CubicO group peptidase (beta-lactamase class C family)